MNTDIRNIVTLNIASNLHKALEQPREFALDGRAHRYRISGHVQLNGTDAGCQFLVNESWQTMPPIAICREPWVRTGAQWHVDEQYRTMCYVYRKQWTDMINSVITSKGELTVVKVAHVWIVENCQWLLNKHVLAEQLGLKSWQKEWVYWPHGECDAAKAYKQEARKQNERNR